MNRYDPNTEEFLTYFPVSEESHSFTENGITAILEDSRNRLWVGIRRNGFNTFDRSTKSFVHYETAAVNREPDAGPTVESIIEDADAGLWFGTSDGVFRFDEERNDFTHVEGSGRTITSLTEYKSGKLLAGSWSDGELFEIDPVDNNCRKVLNHPPGGNVTSLLVDRKGNLWSSLNKLGLGKFDPATETFTRHVNDPSNQFSLSSSVTVSVFQDRTGVIWIGTIRGVNKIVSSQQNFQNISASPFSLFQISSSEISSIYQHTDGTIWVASNHGFERVDLESRRVDNLRNSDPANVFNYPISSQERTSDGKVAIGRGSDLFLYDPATGVSEKISTCENVSIHDLCIGRNGTIWLGTMDGLLRFDPGAKTIEIVESDTLREYRATDPNSRQTVTVLQDRNSKIWFGRRNAGLHSYDPAQQTFTHFIHDPKDPNSISDNEPNTLFEDRTGTLWVGTGNGLNRFDAVSESFQRITTGEGLTHNNIKSVIDDDRGNLWVATNNGLNCVDPDTGSIRNYLVSDGLLNERFGRNLCIKTPDGHLLFGGMDGVDYFDPKQVLDQVDERDLLPQLIGIDVNGIALSQRVLASENAELVLPYSRGDLAFHFTTFDYSNPEEMFYATKLEGYDKTWKANIIPSREYSRLPAGEYRFRILASVDDIILKTLDSDVDQMPGVLSFGFRIKPPFWKTLWFQFLSILLGCTLILFIHYARVQGIHRKSLALENTVQLRTKELASTVQDLRSEKDRLETAHAEIRVLHGILPICCHCKKIRNDGGDWQQMELYVKNHSEADFSHGICPECLSTHYPGFDVGSER